MPRLRLAAVPLAAALSGCLTIGPQALSTNGLAPLTADRNTRTGTTFPDRMLLTGLSVGAELPGGIMGISGTTLRGTQRSDDALGQTASVSAQVKDLTLTLGYPVRALTPNLGLIVGGQWTLRSTRVGSAEGTSFILAPRAALVAAVGKRIVISGHTAYDLPVIDNEALFEVGGTPVRAGMSGLRAGVSVSYSFGTDWF